MMLKLAKSGRNVVQNSSSAVRCFSVSKNRQNIGHGVSYTDTIKDKSSETLQTLPKEADVVVIGGGSLGCNTLYNLAKLGVTNTVLLESHQLTAGTTWHTAGLLWRLRPNDTEIELIRRTRDIILQLEEETGVNPGWINNGGLFIASNKERLDEYKRLMTVGRTQNIESYVLGPSETKKLYPLMNVADVYGTLYSPGDGTIEPAGFCTALTRFATKLGAKVIEKCPVSAIKTDSKLFGGKQVVEVVTPYGAIRTNKVVNATGSWANYITSMVGVTIALVPMKHAYVVTEKIPGIENMPNVRDHDASVYLRLQGDALSIGGYEVDPTILDKVEKGDFSFGLARPASLSFKVEKDFAFGLFDLDWNVFGAHIEGAVNRIPCLEKIGIKSTVCGPESFTPDHKPLMGEDPQVEGFYHCCGFNSAGMMLGGGCGNQMADWIIKGRPELDMFSYDIRRFNPSLNSNKSWAVSRSHEAYAKNYSIVFPHDEPLAARGQKKIPLHHVLEERGCVFQERHGWERPGWFNTSPSPIPAYDWYGAYETPLSSDTRYKTALTADYTFDFPPHHDLIREECLAARFRAALFDMSYFGQIFIIGRDAQKAVDWLFTAKMQKEVGSVVYTCMLNGQGGIEADLTVGIMDGSDTCIWEPSFRNIGFYLAIGGGITQQTKAHILKECRAHKWDLNLIDYTDKMGLISLQGPKSREILQMLTDADLSNENFPFSTHKIINIGGHNVRAMRLSFVGEMGWEFHVPVEAALPVFKALDSAGENFQIANGGYRALDSLSCEKGYVLWHADIRPDDTPLEAGLGFTCKMKTSTPFLGREALEEQKRNKPRKKLITFTLPDSSTPVIGLEGIWRDNEPVGFVRRAEYGFYLGTSVGRGYVQSPCGGAITGSFLSSGNWEIDVMGKRHPIEIHLKSPFDPKNLRVKGFYENSENDLKVTL